jgi:hypothetical protein
LVILNCHSNRWRVKIRPRFFRMRRDSAPRSPQAR